jgi:hypothetical protein
MFGALIIGLFSAVGDRNESNKDDDLDVPGLQC